MHQNPSRMVRERRQTTPTTPVSTPSTTAIVDGVPSVVNLSVPTSTKVLAAVVAILAVVLLFGIGLCMFRRYKRKTQKSDAPSHIIDFTSEKTRRYEVESKLDLHASAYGLEKPSPAFMPRESLTDMNPGWVPQIKPRGTDLDSQPSSSSSKKSKSSRKNPLQSSRGWDKTFSKFAPSERSPPPSYIVDEKNASFASQIPLPPTPPQSPPSTIPPTPPTPPAKKKSNPFSREIPPAKPAPTELLPQMPQLPQLPLPSPARSASFAAHQSASFAQLGREEEQEMPRLMTVVNSFTPTLEDELSIQIGEAVRILEEYQDGWALVQRVGRIDAPKGVVPRSCITVRNRVIPSYLPGRRL